jgi:hypothetical protein
VSIAAGLVVWFIGWYRASGKASSDEQTTSLNVAILGVLIAGAGQLYWVLDGRRAVGRRRRALLADAAPVAATVEVAGNTGSAPGEMLAGGGRYYHRLDCGLATGRAAATAARAEHEAAGRLACGVCAP